MGFINLAARWLVEPKSLDKVVIYSQQGNVTYRALQQQVCQLASAFEGFAVQPNDRIVIVLQIPKGIDKPYFDKNGVIWLKCGSDKRRVLSTH